MGTNKLPENMFHVKSISDDTRLAGDKGMMQVTETELIYTDQKTTESWRWPLKFLRKYGCDGEVFSFEAGRKCPGGEGLYAFSAKRASQIFDMVARNINQGGLQPPAGELSPFPSESHPPDPNTLISRRNSSMSQSPGHTHTDQPNYANMDLSGNPLVQVENGLEPMLPQRPVAYKEVVFEHPPEQHPAPQSEKEPRTSYTKIDFVETDNYNRERRLGTLPEMEMQFVPQGRTSTSSVSGGGGLSSQRVAAERGGKRGRMRTYSGPGTSTGRLPSDSSFSSQGSLTESSRDGRPSQSSLLSGAGTQTHSLLALDTQSSGTALYQNVIVSKEGANVHTTPLPQQQQYQNVLVGGGNVDRVFSPSSSTPQPMTNGGSHSTSTPRSLSTSHGGMKKAGSSRNGMSPIVNGHPMAQYADLEHGKSAARKRATSTPVGSKAPNLSYSVMDFPIKEGKQSPNHSSVSSAVPQPSTGGDSSPPTRIANGDIRGRHHLHSVSSIRQDEPLESVASPIPIPVATNGDVKKVQDETKVEYGVLNFPAMEVLSKNKSEHFTHEERDLGHGTSSRKKKN